MEREKTGSTSLMMCSLTEAIQREFCKKTNSQNRAGRSAVFHKTLIFSSKIEKIEKTDQKRSKISQNPYRAGGSAFYDFFF